MPPAARTDTVAGSVVPTAGPIVWFGNVTRDRPGLVGNGEVGDVRGLMLGGGQAGSDPPDGSDATDPNDPPDAAIASLVGRAATVAPDTVAITANVISAEVRKR
jgi:hypothetical protein